MTEIFLRNNGFLEKQTFIKRFGCTFAYGFAELFLQPADFENSTHQNGVLNYALLKQGENTFGMLDKLKVDNITTALYHWQS